MPDGNPPAHACSTKDHRWTPDVPVPAGTCSCATSTDATCQSAGTSGPLDPDPALPPSSPIPLRQWLGSVVGVSFPAPGDTQSLGDQGQSGESRSPETSSCDRTLGQLMNDGDDLVVIVLSNLWVAGRYLDPLSRTLGEESALSTRGPWMERLQPTSPERTPVHDRHADR